MARFVFLLVLAFAPHGWAHAHEFDAERIEVLEADAEILDGDTSTLYVSMRLANGAATTKIVGFESRNGTIGDWVEIRRFFGRERVRLLEEKTVRTQTIYEMVRPDGYLVINDIDPIVYTADFGYLLLHVLFEDGAILDVAVWIDPIYVEIGN